MNSIIEKNLEKMTSNNDGDMPPLLQEESYGGNAGFWKGYSCAAANFHYDQDTGEIIAFGNIQDLSREIVEKYPSHFFRVAADFFKSWKKRIVDYSAPKYVSAEARSILEETVAEYNRRHGFEPPE
jgi:hypothetical protein